MPAIVAAGANRCERPGLAVGNEAPPLPPISRSRDGRSVKLGRCCGLRTFICVRTVDWRAYQQRETWPTTTHRHPAGTVPGRACGTAGDLDAAHAPSEQNGPAAALRGRAHSRISRSAVTPARGRHMKDYVAQPVSHGNAGGECCHPASLLVVRTFQNRTKHLVWQCRVCGAARGNWIKRGPLNPHELPPWDASLQDRWRDRGQLRLPL